MRVFHPRSSFLLLLLFSLTLFYLSSSMIEKHLVSMGFYGLQQSGVWGFPCIPDNAKHSTWNCRLKFWCWSLVWQWWQKWGSDHLALACELSFEPRKARGCEQERSHKTPVLHVDTPWGLSSALLWIDDILTWEGPCTSTSSGAGPSTQHIAVEPCRPLTVLCFLPQCPCTLAAPKFQTV